ncbi:MAG TPA: hypothetical protein DC049_07780 [Spirochaetia bacterium]|nr:hypothetical protein [Spirochaetia bacterium]
MSNSDFLKALNNEFTSRVPRTEYSAHVHWELIKAVTGINTDIIEQRENASREFVKKWRYGFFWNTLVNRKHLEEHGRTTRMGHAEYAEKPDGATDYDSITTNPFSDPEKALELDPVKEYGCFEESVLISSFRQKYEEMEKKFPQAHNMTGIYITMVSGLLEIYGWDTFLTLIAYDDKKLGKIIYGYYEWISQFYSALAKTDIPVIMSHDDICWTSGPFTHPDWYRKYIFPCIKKLWRPLKDAGKKIIFTSDGNWTEFFSDIIDCGADMAVMEPCSDMALFAEKYGKKTGFTGNADCRILLSGTKDDIKNEVKRCMNIGKKYPGFIMAVGNHIPPNTPVDNALFYNEMYEKMCIR